MFMLCYPSFWPFTLQLSVFLAQRLLVTAIISQIFNLGTHFLWICFACLFKPSNCCAVCLAMQNHFHFFTFSLYSSSFFIVPVLCLFCFWLVVIFWKLDCLIAILFSSILLSASNSLVLHGLYLIILFKPLVFLPIIPSLAMLIFKPLFILLPCIRVFLSYFSLHYFWHHLFCQRCISLLQTELAIGQDS